MNNMLQLLSVLILGFALGMGFSHLSDDEPLASFMADESEENAVSTRAQSATRGMILPSFNAPTTLETPMMSYSTDGEGGLTVVQQRTGTKCQTSAGTCTVSPMPINSPCKCGNTGGQIVR